MMNRLRPSDRRGDRTAAILHPGWTVLCLGLMTTHLHGADYSLKIGDYRFAPEAPLANSVPNALPDLQFNGFNAQHPPLLTGQAVPRGNGYALAWTKEVPQVGYDRWTPADPRIPDVQLGERFTIWMRILYGGNAGGDIGYQLIRIGDALAWSTTSEEQLQIVVRGGQPLISTNTELLPKFSRWYDLALVVEPRRITVYSTAITSDGPLTTASETFELDEDAGIGDQPLPLRLLVNTNSAMERLLIYRKSLDAGAVRELSQEARLAGPSSVESVDVGTNRQLFLDDALIESMSDTVRRVLHPVRKHPDNPVIRRTHPQAVEGFGPTFWGSVIYDEQDKLFRCWYQALTFHQPEIFNHLYAVSDDGIRWRKPELDIVASDNRYDPPGYKVGHAGGWLTVRKDSDEPDPQQRYKGFIQHEPLWHVTSPDGLHWTDRGIAAHYTDDTSTAVYHSIRKQYLKIGRFCPDGRSLALRLMMTCVGDSPLAEGNSLWHLAMLPTEDDLQRDPYQQFYHMPAFAYGDAYIGLLGMYFAGPDNGNTETELTFSRDGLNWQRIAPHQPFIPRGGEGEWDSGFGVLPGTGPIVRGDELWFYYSHYNNGHHGPFRDAGIGLATLRRDGFVSLSGKGAVTTKAFALQASRLRINAVGRVSVTVLDINGAALDERKSVAGDNCDHLVELSGELVGRQVRLHFEVDGDLYAFQTSDN